MKKNARELLLKTALDLFYRQGVNNTGISQIIDEAGVARASFYNSFKSKDDLVKACIHQYSRQLIGLSRMFIQQSKNFDEFVSKWISGVKGMEKAGLFHGCPMANIALGIDAGDKRFVTDFKAALQEWKDLLAEYLTALQKKGELDTTADVNILAQRIMVAYEGAITMWRMTGDTGLFDDLVNVMPGLLKMPVK